MKMGEDGLMERSKAKSIINIDCQYALEAGLQLKTISRCPVAGVNHGVRHPLRPPCKAMAMGYDDAYLLSDRKLGGSDTFATDWLWQAFCGIWVFRIKVMTLFIVLAGRQTSDGDTAHVPSQVAANLGILQLC